ncbi:MAG TPA: CHAT domain-containing protein [Gemmatimonadaceae bacterium]|nr:CHAT domain-containing protein [Gemmatimonadaceae bacterium]
MPVVRGVAAVLLILQQFSPPGGESPRAVLLAAARAVQGDSTAAVESRWMARAQHNASDRAALLGLATLARLTYRFPRADSLFARLTNSTSGAPDVYAPYASEGRANALMSRGDFASAQEWFARAAMQARSIGDADARARAMLGLSAARGRTMGTAAEVATLDSVAAFVPDDDPALVAHFRCERAALIARTGGRGAREMAQAGAALARTGGDNSVEARCIQVVGIDLVRQGDLGGASRELTRAEALMRRAHQHSALASLLQWHGYLQVSMGSYGPAQRLLQEAVTEAGVSGNQSALGWALVNLSQISLGVHDLRSADQQAARAARLFTATNDTWGLATAMGFRAQVALEVGDTAHAHALYSQLLGWATKDRQLLAIANARLGLADVAVRGSDFDTATHELAAGRTALSAGGGTGWEDGLAFYDGVVALRRGDLPSASRLLHQDLASLAPDQSSRRYLTQATLAEVLLQQGDTTGAEQMLHAASRQLDSWRATLDDHALRLQAFQLRDPFGGRGPAAPAIIAGVARAGRVQSAFELAEHRRARELRDELARAAALRAHDDTMSSVGTADPPALTAADVQRAIPNANTALLEYVAGTAGQPTTLFVITRGGIGVHILASTDSLGPAIARFNALIASGHAPGALARQLGDAILAPALATLPSTVTHLVIVSDGALYGVPFPALAMHDGHWLIERYAVAMAPSAAVATTLWQRAADTRPARLLAFGDPGFASGPGAPPPLPGSRGEVRDIAHFAPDAVLRLGAAASKAFLETAPLQRFSIIHFATHAVVDENVLAHTRLALSPGPHDDGFVTPGDLAALHLDADVVVLSACRTATGVILGGEGVRGLTAPLLQAGARSVVASEWPVSDRRTVSLMTEFYDGLARGLDVAGALRDAEVRAMHSGAPPREWAAFQLVGDPGVHVALRRAPAWLRWWWRWWND